MTEQSNDALPPEPGSVPDPFNHRHGYTDEEVPEAASKPEPPENDQELGDAEEQEVEDDAV